jgi:glycosyltransferase involved in cell wall biosynthesis
MAAAAPEKRVTVYAPMGTLDHQTGILNAVRSFAAAGWAVEVMTVRNRRYTPTRFAESNVGVRWMPVSFDAEPEPRWAVTILFVLWACWRALLHPPRLVFAGGIRGLFAAGFVARLRRVAYINYQTELYIGAKLNTRAARLVKALERSAAQRALLTIEHDAQRCALLAADLGVAPERIVVVPNAPVGPAHDAASTFLHRRLGLDTTTPLLVCPGTLSEAFQSKAVVRAAQHLPAGWRCVLHSAQPRSAAEPYIRELRELDVGQRVVLSLEPIAYRDIDALMGSARVGIVLYAADLGQNTATVGLASGKLSHFLKAGVPVIVSPLPGLAEFVLEHGVGQVLHDAAALPSLLDTILADEAGYRARALRCFDAELAYERHFAAVLERAETAVAGAAQSV